MARQWTSMKCDMEVSSRLTVPSWLKDLMELQLRSGSSFIPVTHRKFRIICPSIKRMKFMIYFLDQFSNFAVFFWLIREFCILFLATNCPKSFINHAWLKMFVIFIHDGLHDDNLLSRGKYKFDDFKSNQDIFRKF